ncbi:MAG: hypothetical protein EAX86_13480, partial [Candidatus Heimdallarchaeota archaeon]|nr:hypothetical protein [Candidatus Heimdallarchaeota archaeon]
LEKTALNPKNGGNIDNKAEALDNLYKLTVEDLRANVDINPTIDVTLALEEYVEGDTKLFWVPDLTEYPYTFYKINATLRAIGSHTLIYSNLTTSAVPISYLVNMNNTFENLIFPELTDFFGTPPDIDSNEKIIILIYDILDIMSGTQYVAGFFYALNEYLNSELHPTDPLKGYSNEAEILNIDGVEGLSSLATNDFDTVAHELQHMIHWGNDNDENLWFDEGASMFSEYLIGEDPFESGTYKSRFESTPDVSLTYWDYYDAEGLVLTNYGAAFAFYLYLAEHYGGSDFIRDMVLQSTNGIESIEKTFLDMGKTVKFSEIFRNWTIANFLDDTSFAGGSYGYYNTSLSMAVESTYNYAPIPRTENSVPYWGTDYLKFNLPSELPFDLEFQGSIAARFLVSIILKNTTSVPLNTKVIPLKLQTDNTVSFSISDFGFKADEITLTISSYPKLGIPDHDDENPGPPQTYWFLINPEGILISTGDIILLEDGINIQVVNITVQDTNEFVWEEADGATWELYTSFGNFTELTGNFTFNNQMNYWESTTIDISLLSEGDYQFRYYFYNTTAIGVAYSNIFTLSRDTPTTPTTISLIPGFFVVLSVLALAGLKITRD